MQKSDTSNKRGKGNHPKIIRKYLNNTSKKRDQRTTENSHTGHFIHTTSRTAVKVQNVYQVCHRLEIQVTGKLYALGTWTVSVTRKVTKTFASSPAVSTPHQNKEKDSYQEMSSRYSPTTCWPSPLSFNCGEFKNPDVFSSDLKWTDT